MGANARSEFFGWHAVYAAFVLGAFGWGIGFYGPPVFLSVLTETRGWSIGIVSAAITVHFLVGALTAFALPGMQRRLGAALAIKLGVTAMAVGIVGWASLASPWQLFFAAVLSGIGWGSMSAAALNLIVSPWFVVERPKALSMAYNGGSVGGIVFSPLWVTAIGAFGFALTVCGVALVAMVVLWVLAERVFVRTPQAMGLRPDDEAAGMPAITIASAHARLLPGRQLWRERAFVSLAAGMALGLFVQIGLVAHLYSLLVPALGAQGAGWAMTAMTVMAIAGRSALARCMPISADRRQLAILGYLTQLAGCVCFALAAGASVPLLVAGIVLFGFGFGNATSLPPLIAQVEFVAEDVPRVTATIVGISQLGYAFAPAWFGWLRTQVPDAGMVQGAAPAVFIFAAAMHVAAIGAFLYPKSKGPAKLW